MLSTFDSVIGVSSIVDESYVENIFDGDVVERMYNNEHLSGLSIDMGGHVSVLTCRSVLVACDRNPVTLAKMLNYRGKQGLEICKEIVNECEAQVAASSFVV